MLRCMASHLDDPAHDPQARAALEAWRSDYRQRLAAETGWWAVTNLAWVEGDAWLGGGSDDALRLPSRVPARLAHVEAHQGGLLLTPAAAEALELDGEPLTGPVHLTTSGARLRPRASGGVEIVVVERAGRWGVRVYDATQVAARAGEPVGWFEPAPGWCVDAVVESGDGLEALVIVDVLGHAREVPVAARLRFDLGGRERTLLATDAGGALFVNFRDATNGVQTYGAGRFLVVERADGTNGDARGRARLDFHRAYHPPCAHTPHAMCPLPPLANRLDLAVLAGERYPEP